MLSSAALTLDASTVKYILEAQMVSPLVIYERPMIRFGRVPLGNIRLSAIILLLSLHLLLPSKGDGRQELMLHNLQLKPAAALNLSIHGITAAEIDEKLSAIYQRNNYQPFWIENGRIGQRAHAIREVLLKSGEHGLKQGDYLLSNIKQFWNSADLSSLFRLDIILTLAMIRYVADQREGRLQPRMIDPVLFATASDVSVNWPLLLNQAFRAQDMHSFLTAQEPPFEQYRLLKKKLAQYRALEQSGGWPRIKPGTILKPGDRDARIPLLRTRLSMSGDLASINRSDILYDEQLVAAVKRFQVRHNLTVDGVIGSQTLNRINVPVSHRIKQIIVNMERYRWLDRSPKERMVIVNIAGYELLAGKPGTFDLTMPVIVGKTYHETPVFSDRISSIVFNPYWNIPPSIAQNELLPKLQADPLYLQKQNITIFHSWKPGAEELDSTRIDWKRITQKQMSRYFLRQDPGPNNALGTIKFMFPNSYNVYLHDTPVHALFQRADRALSHGCIRVSQPQELATWILKERGDEWDRSRVRKVVDSGKRLVVDLKRKIPVYILYRTAIVTPDRRISFYDDIYNRDKRLIETFWTD